VILNGAIRIFVLTLDWNKGKDERQASSPSFFNAEEASLVKKYVEALRSNSRLRLTNSHIGIISPYNAQVGKIRGLLRAGYSDVKVGSVEEFQGQVI
jgi:helicase MOV-10